MVLAGHPQPAAWLPACDTTAGSIVNTSVSSQVYGVHIPVSVYLPACYTALSRSLPVIYLLHGAGADQTQWLDVNVRLSADAVIAQSHTPFIVVMPGGEYRYGVDYGAFVLDELLPAMERQYNVSADADNRAIGGISLGGYWALQLAFKHPDMFEAAGGHSPVVSGYGAGDPLNLARTASGLGHLRVMLDAGDADALRSGASQLADVLRTRLVTVSFAINSGAHNRPYWRAHSEEYLTFYAQSFSSSGCSAQTHPWLYR
jgi:enterochelin esterase-like enzyme